MVRTRPVIAQTVTAYTLFSKTGGVYKAIGEHYKTTFGGKRLSKTHSTSPHHHGYFIVVMKPQYCHLLDG